MAALTQHTQGTSTSSGARESTTLVSELLGYTTGTIRGFVDDDNFARLSKVLIETIDSKCNGWIAPGKDRKGIHLVRAVAPVDWEALEELKLALENRASSRRVPHTQQITIENIQEHRKTILKLDPMIAHAVHQHLSGAMEMTRAEFVTATLNWVKQCLKDSLDRADARSIVLTEQYEFPVWYFDSQKRAGRELEVKQLRRNFQKFEKQQAENGRAFANQSFSAAATAGVALGNLCREVGYHGELRERAAGLRRFHEWQDSIVTKGMSVFSQTYVRQLTHADSLESRRKFHEVLYDPMGRVHGTIERYIPEEVLQVRVGQIVEQFRDRFSKTHKVKSITRYVQNKILKIHDTSPCIFLCGTKTEGRYLGLMMNELFDAHDRSPGIELSSDITGAKRDHAFEMLSAGDTSFIVTTAIENINTDSFSREVPVRVLVTSHRRKKLTQYPVIRNLLEVGIPVRIVSFMTKNTSDSNARSAVSRNRKTKSTVLFESGSIDSIEQLEFFESLVTDQDSTSKRTPKQVEVLMQIFQSLERLRREIYTQKTLSRKRFEEFEDKVSMLRNIAHRSIRAKSAREKFETDLTTLFARELRSARGVFLEQGEVSAVDIKNYAQYFKVLTLFMHTDRGDSKKQSVSRAFVSGLAREFEDILTTLPFDGTSSLRSLFGAEKLSGFMKRRVSEAIVLTQQYTNLPYQDALHVLEAVQLDQ